MIKGKLVFNNYIPFKGYKAITFIPWIFVRKDASHWTLTDERHETTHLNQQLEVLVLSLVVALTLALFGVISWWWLLATPFAFYVEYVLEWVIRIPFCHFDSKLAYYNIMTEQEAYLHEDDLSYNYERHHFAFLKYLLKNSFVRDPVTKKIVKKQ